MDDKKAGNHLWGGGNLTPSEQSKSPTDYRIIQASDQKGKWGHRNGGKFRGCLNGGRDLYAYASGGGHLSSRVCLTTAPHQVEVQNTRGGRLGRIQ